MNPEMYETRSAGLMRSSAVFPLCFGTPFTVV
ncbi:MAG: hypothetical protein JWR01_2111 [Subtercola sp.]|nr:hypothetical protein [Subtercola sp.]